MTSPMDLRTLLFLSLLVLTQTMPTKRNKRELVNSDEAESAEFSDSPVQHGPSPKKYESPGDAGNDIVVDAQADLGGEGKGTFTLSLRDHINNFTTELVTLVFTDDMNGQSNTEGVRDGLALGTGPSMTTGLGSVSNSASVSLEQSSDSSQVSSESSSSSVPVSVELTSNSIETSAEPLNLSTDPRSASNSQESAEGNPQSLTIGLPSNPSAAPTEVSQTEEEEADEDDVDEDDVDEDDEEELEPPTPTSPSPTTFPTGTAVDTSVAPEVKDPYSGGVSGEPMLADQSVDMLARTGVSGGKNMVTAEAALMQLYGGEIDGKKNIVNQVLDFPAADQTSRSHSISIEIVPFSQETAKTKDQGLNTDLPSDPSAAPATLSPQPDATTAAQGEEEVDEDELDEDEVEEDDEDKAGNEVVPTIVTPEVDPAISAAPSSPDSHTSNAADPVVPSSGIAVDNAAVVSLGKELCSTLVCDQNTGYDPLLNIEGFVGDDPLSYAAADQEELPNVHTDSLTNKQTLTDGPAELTSELNSVLESPSVSSNSLAFVGVPSHSLDMQNLNTDPGTVPVNEGAVEAIQSDPSVASAEQSSQPDATTAAPEEEGDEDEVDEDEVEEDDEDETGGEVTVAPTTSASPPALVFPTGNAVDTSVAPSGLSVDTVVAPQLKDPCTDPGCALEYDPLLDTEGYVGDDPQSYMVDQLGSVSENPQTDTLTDKQTLIDAPAGVTSELNSVTESASVSSNALVSVEASSNMPQNPNIQGLNTDTRIVPVNQEATETSQSDPSAVSATLSPLPDATTAAAGEEEGDEDEVDEDEIEEDDEDETGNEVTPSIVTPEVSPTISAAPPVPVLPTINAVDASVPPAGIPVDVAAAPQLNDPLLDTEGYVGDDPLSYTADQPAFSDTNSNALTDAQALPEAPAGLTSDLNNMPGALGISSTAATSVEILVLPSNVIEVSIELENPNTGSGPAISSQESVEAGLQSHITDLPSDPSGVPVTQAPQPNSTTIVVEEEEKDEDEDEDEDESALVNPSDVSLQAGPIPDTPSLSIGVAVSAEAPIDSSQVSVKHSPVSGSLSVELPANSVEISAESAQLPSEPSASAPATTDPPPTVEEENDEDEDDEDETGNATQVPPALLQIEPLSFSSSTAVSAEGPSDSSQISLEPIQSSATVLVELPSNSSEVSLESGITSSVSVELPLNSSNINMDVAFPQTVLVSVSIEANSAPSFKPPSAPSPPSAVQTKPGTGGIVMETALTSSEERLAEQEKAELALNTASDPQVNTELAVANPWTEFLRSLGTRTPPQQLQQRGPSNTNLSATKTGVTKPLPAKVAQSSSEEN